MPGTRAGPADRSDKRSLSRASETRYAVARGAPMRIHRLDPGEDQGVLRANHLWDGAPDRGAVRASLADDRTIFLLAVRGGAAIGFLRGTELGQLKSRRKQVFLHEIEVEER